MSRSPDSPFEFRSLLECRVTTTVLVSALTLSILHLQGRDLSGWMAGSGNWMSEPWRLVTTTLLHGSILHLAFNLYWTAIFGTAVERAFGSLATAGSMLLLAVASSAPQVALAGGGIGLSGVGYGLFGFLWVLDRWDPRHRGLLDPRTTQLFVVWFFLCIVLDVTGAMNIGNIAHGAGALVGAATGWAVAHTSRGIATRALPLFLVLSAVICTCTVLRPVFESSAVRTWHRSIDGYRALEKGDTAQAERLLADAVEGDPGNWASWWLLGEARWRSGEYASALEAMERAAELHDLEPAHAKYLAEVRAWVKDPRRLDAPSGTSK